MMGILGFLGGAFHLVIQPYFLVAAVGIGLAAWMALQAQVRLAVVILILAGLVSAWLMFQGLQAQVTAANAALAQTRALLATSQAQAHLNQVATNEADHTQRTDAATRGIVQQAYRALTDAADRNDSHALYVAWVDGINRLRNDTGPATA